MTRRELAVIELSQPILETTDNRMRGSTEFNQFGRMFIQDIDLFTNSLEEAIDWVIKGYDASKSENLRNFIDKILESDLTHHELQRLWSATDSDIYFKTAEGFKEFLRMTRDRL